MQDLTGGRRDLRRRSKRCRRSSPSCHSNSRRIHLRGLPQRELDVNFVVVDDWLLCSTVIHKLNDTALFEPFQIFRDLLDISSTFSRSSGSCFSDVYV